MSLAADDRPNTRELGKCKLFNVDRLKGKPVEPCDVETTVRLHIDPLKLGPMIAKALANRDGKSYLQQGAIVIEILDATPVADDAEVEDDD